MRLNHQYQGAQYPESDRELASSFFLIYRPESYKKDVMSAVGKSPGKIIICFLGLTSVSFQLLQLLYIATLRRLPRVGGTSRRAGWLSRAKMLQK